MIDSIKNLDEFTLLRDEKHIKLYIFMAYPNKFSMNLYD